ncbi:MAG: virulence RhuM family protein [Bacteroidales bacterium]|nr:virulence RhuM family protein [Bacteroidales bacterium]
MAENGQPTTNTGEIILYQPDSSICLEVRMEKETVWLKRQQIATLFDRDIKTISKHINNALSQELSGLSTVAKFATVQQEGNRLVNRDIEYFNLDMILSVGYRVKSQKGILFRQWANSVLKEYLLRGYAVNRRIERLEERVSKTEEQIGFFVQTALPPKEGIFFDGQIFDAYTFASDLIRSAQRRIILIDNYIDDSVLLMLAKRGDSVTAEIVTRRVTETLSLDLERHNRQYPPITVRECDRYHDRFLIIDDTVYHLGASLKDLGKRLFAFNRMEIGAEEILTANS